MKRILAILLAVVMVLGLVACGGEKPAQDAETPAADNWKIAIMTGTVSQNEEEYRAAENVQKKYGKDHVMIMTYPDKFTDEQETTIANVVSMVEDPDCKALVFVQGVPGAAAAIDKAREINPDLLVLVGVPGETPDTITPLADVVMQLDELKMGTAMPAQAKKQGAKVFVHYSFPRHMSYPLLAKRRDMLKEECGKIGLEFVDATAPDPTGDAGISGAQQFILEDVPKMVEQYGKDTAFFSTNCSMQVPLIQACVQEKAIYPQPCCPSPFHGFPSALNLEIGEEDKGNVPKVVEQIKAKLADEGMTGRMSTWPVPVVMMMIEAGSDYAVDYINGETEGKLDVDKLKENFEAYAGLEADIDVLEEGGVTYDNFLMIFLDYLDL